MPENRRECWVFFTPEPPRAEREFPREKGLGGVLWGIGVALDVRSSLLVRPGGLWRGLARPVARTWGADGPPGSFFRGRKVPPSALGLFKRGR